jgi:hypothetical protein
MDKLVVNNKISKHYAKLFEYNSIVDVDLTTPCHPSSTHDSSHQYCSHTVVLADKTFYGTKLQHLITQIWHGSKIVNQLLKSKNIISDDKKKEALTHFEKYIITEEDFKTRFNEIKISSIWIDCCVETSSAQREVTYKLGEKVLTRFEKEPQIAKYLKHHEDMFLISKEDLETLKKGIWDGDTNYWMA